MTARGAAARVARLRRELGERDTAVLHSLYRLRLLGTDQIKRLHFAENSPSTQARRTREVLRRLTEQHLVVRLGREVGGVGAGSRSFVFGLSGLGQAVLDLPGPLGRRRRTVWQTKPYFHDHLLAVAETYVELVEACRSGDTELLAFDAEPACWRRFPGPGGGVVVLKPDAYLRVGIGEFEQRAFLEIDLGTESLPTVLRKCQLFVNYWRSGLEQQRYGVFPRVHWAVPTQRRLDGIAEVLQRLANQTAGALFTVTLAAETANTLTTLPEPGGGAP